MNGRAPGRLPRSNRMKGLVSRGLFSVIVLTLLVGCVPRTAVVLNRAGLNYYRHGQYEKAYESFSKAISLSPDSAETYYNRAGAAEKLARFKDAGADFTKAIELDPGYVEAYLGRGDLSFSRNHYEAARTDWSSVIEISPNNAEAFRKRGQALERLDRADEATSDFDRAVALAPKEPAALISRGLFYFRTGRFEKALADFTAAALLDPKSPEPYLRRGIVYEYGLSDYTEALDEYDRAVKIDPEDPFMRNNRGNLLRKLGKTEEALADFSAICRMGYPFGCWQYDWLINETR